MSRHWQPKERKRYIAEDVREWIKHYDPGAKMESLERLSTLDLTVLMLALRSIEQGEGKN